MSSKEQYKDALKREAAQIRDLKAQLTEEKHTNQMLRQRIEELKRARNKNIEMQTHLYLQLQKTKRWYQIFIKYPI
jgi:hypothetical protein